MNNFSKSITINASGNVVFFSGTDAIITQYELSGNQWVAKDAITPSVSSIQNVGNAEIVSLACNKNNNLLSATVKNDYNIYVLIFEHDGASWSEVFQSQLNNIGIQDPELGKVSMHSEENYIAVTNINNGQKFLQVIKKESGTWGLNQTIGDDAHGRISKNGEIVFLKKEGNAIYSGSIDGPTFPEVKVTDLSGNSNKILAISGEGSVCAIEENNLVKFYQRKNNAWSLYFTKQKQPQQKIKKLIINKNGSRFGIVCEDKKKKVEVFQIEGSNLLTIDKPLFNQDPNTKGNFAEAFESNEDMSIIATSEEDVGINFFEIQVERKSVRTINIEHDFGDTSWFAREAYRLDSGDFPVEEKGVLLTNEKRIVMSRGRSNELVSYFPEIENEKPLFKKTNELTNKYNSILIDRIYPNIDPSRTVNYEINWYYPDEQITFGGYVDPVTDKIILNDAREPTMRDKVEGPKAMFQKFIPKDSESDENLSPWGSRKGIYEFINSITIDEFKTSNLIKRKTEDVTQDTKLSNFCADQTNKRLAGYCKPRSISDKASIAADGFLNKNNLYGKNFIESAVALDTRIEEDFFYDMTINSFWKNFIQLIKEKQGLLAYQYDFNTMKNQWVFAIANPRGLQKILSEELVDFLEARLGSIPTTVYSREYCEKNNIDYAGGIGEGLTVLDVAAFSSKSKLLEERSGYNNPYIGYNQDGHFIQRRLIFMPIKKVVAVDREDPNALFGRHLDRIVLETEEYVAAVEWSVNYSDVFGKKNEPSIYKKYYELDDDFFYRGSNYNVYGNFPFKDFNMSPVRWSEEKTKYLLIR